MSGDFDGSGVVVRLGLNYAVFLISDGFADGL